MPSRRSRKAEILLGLGGLFAGLLLAELLLAVFFPQQTQRGGRERSYPIFAPSELLPYSLRPKAAATLSRDEFRVPIRINSLGYRGEEFTPDKGKRFRILAVGDSFTFGFGCRAEDAFPARLEAELRARVPDPEIEVVNAGFAACYYPDTYYLYLKEIGFELDPDLIVVGFFLGNDVDHPRAFENRWTEHDEAGLPTRIVNVRTKVEDGDLVPRRLHWRHRVPFLRNSHLAQLAISFAKEQRSKPKRPGPDAYYNPFMYREPYRERTEFLVREVQRLFTAMAEQARERDIPLLVLMIPSREQIYREQYGFERYERTRSFDLDKPQRLFARYFQQRGIDYLDLLPLLRSEPPEALLYFQDDAHWNELGHRLAGAALADHLQGSDLLPIAAESQPSPAP